MQGPVFYSSSLPQAIRRHDSGRRNIYYTGIYVIRVYSPKSGQAFPDWKGAGDGLGGAGV